MSETANARLDGGLTPKLKIYFALYRTKRKHTDGRRSICTRYLRYKTLQGCYSMVRGCNKYLIFCWKMTSGTRRPMQDGLWGQTPIDLNWNETSTFSVSKWMLRHILYTFFHSVNPVPRHSTIGDFKLNIEKCKKNQFQNRLETHRFLFKFDLFLMKVRFLH